MKNKLNKLMSNSWTIAILAPIITTIIVACFKRVNIIEAIQLIFNFMEYIFNYKISIWVIIMTLSIIVIVFYCYIKITHISEEPKPKWLNYTQDTYKKWIFKWTYEKNYGKYSIENLQPVCSCGCGLIQKSQINSIYYGGGILYCPKCNSTYATIDNEIINEFKTILYHNIETGNYCAK